MEDSPNMPATQRPAIGWDMESPQTTKVTTPRSVILPKPKPLTNASPRFLVEQWGSSSRTKRRLKRPPKPNLYKRPGLSEPESDEFDDGLDDEMLSQISITTPGSGKEEKKVTPVLAGPSSSRTKQEHAFKTPTTFKHYSYSYNTEAQKVLPRKLTTEFDNAQPANNKPDLQRKPMTTIGNPLKYAPTNPKNLNNQPRYQTESGKQPTAKKDNLENSFDEFFGNSSDDEELMKQTDMFLATQNTTPAPNVNTNIIPANPNKQLLNSNLNTSNKLTTPSSTNNNTMSTTMINNKTNDNQKMVHLPTTNSKRNSPQSYDSDVDFFQDDDDDDMLLEMTSELATKDKYHTPPRTGNTQQRKKQKLSLSLKRNKP